MSRNRNVDIKIMPKVLVILAGILIFLLCLSYFSLQEVAANPKVGANVKVVENPTVGTNIKVVENPKVAANPDEDLPIEIQSDSGDFDDKTGNATHRGHVEVNQGTRHLTADKLIIHRNKDGKIDHMTAYGINDGIEGTDAEPVRFEALPEPNKPKLEGEAKIMKYFPHEEKIILLEEARLTQNNHTVRGPVITYFLKTRVLSSESDESCRTTVIINPKEQSSKEKSS